MERSYDLATTAGWSGGSGLGGEESNPHSLDQNQMSCHWTTPDRWARGYPDVWRWTRGRRYSHRQMGSLIKKRRKRMRKKKHKKMLKRTRFQRRAKK